MPQSVGGRPSKKTINTDVNSFKAKKEALKNIGLIQEQGRRYEQLFKHPETVKKDFCSILSETVCQISGCQISDEPLRQLCRFLQSCYEDFCTTVPELNSTTQN